MYIWLCDREEPGASTHATTIAISVIRRIARACAFTLGVFMGPSASDSGDTLWAEISQWIFGATTSAILSGCALRSAMHVVISRAGGASSLYDPYRFALIGRRQRLINSSEASSMARKTSIVLSVAMFVALIVVSKARAQSPNDLYNSLDCGPVMKELHNNKTPRDVAFDLKVPVPGVYNCMRRARAARIKRIGEPSASPVGVGGMATPSPTPIM